MVSTFRSQFTSTSAYSSKLLLVNRTSKYTEELLRNVECNILLFIYTLEKHNKEGTFIRKLCTHVDFFALYSTFNKMHDHNITGLHLLSSTKILYFFLSTSFPLLGLACASKSFFIYSLS